jgi:hypothetical protein
MGTTSSLAHIADRASARGGRGAPSGTPVASNARPRGDSQTGGSPALRSAASGGPEAARDAGRESPHRVAAPERVRPPRPTSGASGGRPTRLDSRPRSARSRGGATRPRSLASRSPAHRPIATTCERRRPRRRGRRGEASIVERSDPIPSDPGVVSGRRQADDSQRSRQRHESPGALDRAQQASHAGGVGHSKKACDRAMCKCNAAAPGCSTPQQWYGTAPTRSRRVRLAGSAARERTCKRPTTLTRTRARRISFLDWKKPSCRSGHQLCAFGGVAVPCAGGSRGVSDRARCTGAVTAGATATSPLVAERPMPTATATVNATAERDAT